MLLRRILPHRWWMALLMFWARLRCAIDGQMGESYGWIWDREGATFDRVACQRLLHEEILPTFERITRGLPQPYGVDRFLALVWFNSPSGYPEHRVKFDFSMAQLKEARERIAAEMLSLMPMEMRRGTQMGFIVANVSEMTLYGFRSEMTRLRSIDETAEWVTG